MCYLMRVGYDAIAEATIRSGLPVLPTWQTYLSVDERIACWTYASKFLNVLVPKAVTLHVFSKAECRDLLSVFVSGRTPADFCRA